MDLSGLRVVRAIAETGSVSRAALALNCVQSNVTARLKKLEEELGTPLFTRLSRGMSPTPAGSVLADYADRVLRLVGQARDAVLEVSGRGGRLSIGTMETTAAVRLPTILARFHAEHPLVQFTLRTGTSEESLNAVLSGQLDGAFVAGPVDHQKLTASTLFVEELVLVEPRSPGVGEGCCTLLAFREGCGYRSRAEYLLRQSGQVPYRVMEFGALDAILGCVAAGMGLTVLPRRVVEREPWCHMLRITPITLAEAQVPTCFVRRVDQPETQALHAFLAVASADEAMDSWVRPGTPALSAI